jgi:potassium efflux system protein
MRTRVIVVIIAGIAGLLANEPLLAQEMVGLGQITREIEAQRRADAELATALARVEEEAGQEVDRLQRDEATLDVRDATVADLRELRSEIDGRKIRLEAIDARNRAAEDQISRLETRIEDLGKTTAAEPTSIEEIVQVVELRRLRDLRDLVVSSIDLQNRARIAIVRRLGLLEERRTLAEARSRLTSFDETKELDRDPRAAALREIVARLGEDSVRLLNQAEGPASATPEFPVRRGLLVLQADRTFLRSNLRAGDIELMGIGVQLEFLRTLLADPSVPPRLLEEGNAVLARLSERTEQRLSALAEARRQLADQAPLLLVSSADLAPQLDYLRSIGDQLKTLADDQEAEIRRLETVIFELQQGFADRARIVEAETLYQQRPLPAGAEAWGHVGASLTSLPASFGEGFKRTVEQVIRAISDSAPQRLAAAGSVMAALFLAALWGRREVQRRFIEPGRTGAWAAAAAALHNSLPTLVPALAWFATAKILRVPEAPLLLVLIALAVWPIVSFLLDLARRLLLSDAASAQSAVSHRFYLQLRWTMILGGVIAGLVTITSALPLTPAMADLVERVAMLCLLLIALLGLLLPRLILTLWGNGCGEPPLRIRIAAGLSILMPVLLTSAALLGLAGYLNLAWSMTSLLVWLLVVGGVCFLLLGLLRDGAAHLRERIIERRGDLGDFWIVDFFDPAYRLLQLGLILSASWALVRIYGWTAETPGVRHLLAFGRTPIVSLGQSALTIQDIVIVVIMVTIAFWVGGWSRHVSYNLALLRINDLSIRHSLSIFVQYVVTVLGLILALKVIGLDMTALTVFAASIGVGIGFGMQNVVNNFISGILLLAERPLRVGDTVTIGSATGDVTRIGIRSLTVSTFERKEVIIPNSAVISEVFTNWTKTDDTLREVLMFRVSFFDDVEHAVELIAEVARSTEGVLASPPSKATVWEFAEIGISIRLQYFIHATGPSFDIRDRILRDVLEAFAAEGFTIPTSSIEEKPLRPLHGRQTPVAVALTSQPEARASPPGNRARNPGPRDSSG